MTEAPPAPPPPRKSWLPVMGVALIALGVVFAFAKLVDNARPTNAPRVYSSMAKDLYAVERSGKQVSVSSLKGKVVAIAHVYTVCPHGCMAVLGEMNKLQKAHGDRADFHQVSVAVIPSHDTPEYMRSFVSGMGLPDAAPWWFVTGAQDNLWNFMTDGLGLNKPEPIPEEERLNPLDLFAHDLRIVLLDREQRVRGYYDVAHPQPEIASLMKERLQEDVQFLLDHPDL